MAQFFSNWDPLPPFAPAPEDGGLEQRISKLAEFAAKNGPPFVQMIREKQSGNAEYGFLAGGPGAEYFTWKLYSIIYRIPADQPLHLAPGQPAPHQIPPPAFRDNPSDQAHPSGHAGMHEGAQPASEPWRVLEQAVAALPQDISIGYSSVLDSLTGTRQSIKESKDWFMAATEHAEGMAAQMALHQHRLPTYEAQIHVIYLANDVLLKRSFAATPAEDGENPIARAFRPALPLMLHSAYRVGGGAPEVQQRLVTILDHWVSRQVYDQAFAESLKKAMVEGPTVQHAQPAGQPGSVQSWDHAQAQGAMAHGQAGVWEGQGGPRGPPAEHWDYGPPNPGGQPPIGSPGFHSYPGANPHQMQQHAPRQWQDAPMGPPLFPPQQPHAFPPPDAFSYPPPQGPPQGGQGYGHPQEGFASQGFPGPGGLPMPGWSGAPGGFPNPGLVMPPPDLVFQNAGPPQPVPTDPMSFPPGLLPALVKENLRTEEAYYPLSKTDVERAGIPPMQDADPYLLARLDKFYAELQDYRPGQSRAEVEDSQRRQRTRNALGERSQHTPTPHDRRTGLSDGSYRGEKRDGGPAGLGFGDTGRGNGNPDDPFSQYRTKRSTFYHDSIARVTGAKEPQPVS